MDFETFIKWALPKMGFRWEGFRRVIGQVESCVRDRLVALDIGGYEAYRAYLDEHPGEWEHLDACCRITISRFYRDAPVFDALRSRLRQLAEEADEAGRSTVRTWSAGAASGEEPYTLAACWHFDLADDFPDLDRPIVASEAGPHMIERAEHGVYPDSSLREVPESWRPEMFEAADDEWRLRAPFREDVSLICHDVRDGPPPGIDRPFDLICCRYLIFTYCNRAGQLAFLNRIAPALRPGGYLVVGADERLPEDDRFRAVDESTAIAEYLPRE